MTQSCLVPGGDAREPDLSFDHARCKVAWAEHVLGVLQSNVAGYLASYSQADSISFHHETGEFSVNIPPIALDVVGMAGDIIFNLRSALDCCWMGLKRAVDASAKKGTLPRANTRDGVKGTIGNASVEHAFPGSDSFVLDTLKPYKNGNEVIWFGGQMDNWNKHNMLLLAVQTATISMSATLPSGGPFIFSQNRYVIRGPGKLPDSFGPGIRPHGKPHGTFNIVLETREPGEERLLMPFLLSLFDETRKAVEGFATTFARYEGG